MAVITAIDFKAEARKLFKHFDRLDFEKLGDMFTDDVQGVDELSRGWIRGKAGLKGYFDRLDEMGVSDIHSTASDFALKHWDDVALVTCMLAQTYAVAGEPVAITAPVSVLFKHTNGAWKIALVHAVPLSESS